MEGRKVFTPEESTEMLSYIAQNMATKADVEEMGASIRAEMRGEMATKVELQDFRSEIREELRGTEQRLRDYTDKRVTQAEDKIISFARHGDEKLNETIRILELARSVSTEDARRLIAISPFHKAV